MKYFGTDGIRRPAEDFSAEFLARIVKGLTDYAGNEVKVFLAGDTRESTEWILQDLAAACETFGVEYSVAGVLPTPAINYCFYEMGYDFAIDVTASHNPVADNGIKIFERGEGGGRKLCKEACDKIERVLDDAEFNYVPVAVTDREDLQAEAVRIYIEHLKGYLGEVDFSGLKVGIDCANGATSVVGEKVFEDLGAETQIINANSLYNVEINLDCGSTHPERLQELVTVNHLDFGAAYDGDGDRCILVDSFGNLVDGDQIIAILANYLKLDAVAVTVMSNQGLMNWAKDAGVRVEVTPVGDSNVAAAMREQGIRLGGEQSGHVILPGEATGDGILTSLMVAKVMTDTGKTLAELAGIITRFPQVIVNLPATDEQKLALKESDAVKKLLVEYSKKLEEYDGRLLVRPSGTEALIRITMWGNDEAVIEQLAEDLKLNLKGVL